MDISKIVLDNDRLRPHQVSAKERIFKAWHIYDSVMLQMPTGTGKTYLFTSIIKDLLTAYKKARIEINILIVAHRNELLDQISATLNRFDIPHGFIQSSRTQYLWKRVQVGSIMSLLTDKNYMNTCRQKFNFIFVDEAHHSLAESYVDLFNLFPDAKKLGVTATPWRFNHESFLSLYQTLVESPQISWFIENNILSDFDYVSVKPNSEIQRLVDSRDVAVTGDFVNADLDITFNNNRIRAKLFDSYLSFAKDRKGIIYAINRIHATKIADMYSSHGVKAVAIDCETPKEDRQRLIAQFKAGEVMVLVNVDIFTEGFDCPDVSFIQLARPTRSLALFLQQVGRGLRIAEGKERTIILDNVGLYNYFGLPDANRKWLYHFNGHENIENDTRNDGRGRTSEDGVKDHVYDEYLLGEDDEEMMVVRGIGTCKPAFRYLKVHDHHSKTNALPIEEFSVADYYLVRGNMEKFKIYPFKKKKGKRTEGVAGCIYEYVFSENPFFLNHNPHHNAAIIEKDVRLDTILSFTAMLLRIEKSEILHLGKIAEKVNVEVNKNISLFELFNIIRKIS